jgi:hypothetical protein
MIKISLEFCQILAPNCGGSDTLTLLFLCTDLNNNKGSVRLIGTKNAINSIDNTNSLLIDGVSGPSSFNTAFGVISTLSDFDAGFNIEENISVKLDVTDCKGWSNVESDIGFTNAAMTDTNNYLQTHDDEYIRIV